MRPSLFSSLPNQNRTLSWSARSARNGITLILLCLGIATASAELKVANIFGNHMILQRDRPLPIWGTSTPGDSVTVSFAGQKVTTKADAQGAWTTTLQPLAASKEAREMRIDSETEKNSQKISDVLVGDVWICGGQSNMGLYLKESFDAEAAIAAADRPQIRLRPVPPNRGTLPVPDLAPSDWAVCTPEKAADFAAVAYHFGRALQEKVGVPIGLIEFDRGATGIEGWVPLAGLAAMPGELTRKLHETAASWDPHQPLGKRAFTDTFTRIREWIPLAQKALANGTAPPPEPLVPAPSLTVPGPTELFNGTVHPLVPFAIKGVIWYQGESNPGEGPEYEQKMTAMIRGWRAAWGQGNFPFYWVQLANEGSPARTPDQDVASRYVPVREAQRRVLKEPATGMVVAIDLGEDANGHPRNKRDVGQRLALWALARDYGKDNPFSGPLYTEHQIEKDRIVISFDHIGSGLMVGNKEGADGRSPILETPDAPLGHFSLCGDDNIWHWAEARIVGDKVEVRSDNVPAPKQVRYAYTMNPKGPKLYNRHGLPASPFSSSW